MTGYGEFKPKPFKVAEQLFLHYTAHSSSAIKFNWIKIAVLLYKLVYENVQIKQKQSVAHTPYSNNNLSNVLGLYQSFIGVHKYDTDVAVFTVLNQAVFSLDSISHKFLVMAYLQHLSNLLKWTQPWCFPSFTSSPKHWKYPVLMTILVFWGVLGGYENIHLTN